MGYWKTKVLPKIKKVFEKSGNKKAAAEASKAFDDSKEEIGKAFEEKKGDLQPKVLEIYEASPVEIKTLVKERTDAGLKKNSSAVTKFLEELAKIEFPGSKLASEASSKFGAANASATIFFIFEKISVLLPPEEASSAKDREVVVAEEDKKGEVEVVKVEDEKKVEDETSTPPPPPTEEKKEPATEEAAGGDDAAKP
ncbi:hypothetical protein HPP92_008623 [Vanilla planifolia]|uniref:Plasma membrane-associated cation-binding protein 1 n=1 Tax=Vanilla planifolia TaxID=51239 RepID=A0A835RHP4_VANPL|nr:hypothetical protein HPP92_008623 [Vanilla planifolia]